VPLRFGKYEGLGNDFLIVDTQDLSEPLAPAEVVALCARHTGVGADGVLLVDSAAPSMRVLNADGSAAEMCGNGLRCVVWHLARRGLLRDPTVVETDAGPHECWLRGPEDVEVAMCPATFEPSAIPVKADAPVVDGAFEGDLRYTAVGMGNPHAVFFGAFDEATRRELGPRIQSDARFPAGVNVGFATPSDDGFVLHVLERGAGWTQACGTGACAAAAAAVETGRAERHQPMTIRLPGGPLQITIGEVGETIRMRGPARHVFDGALP